MGALSKAETGARGGERLRISSDTLSYRKRKAFLFKGRILNTGPFEL